MNRYLQPLTLKRFTLTATATAILSLHAELANAAVCPSQIVGTALAGVICDFSAGASVTVQNGGVVGGISMVSYHPSASQLTIDAGGVVSNATGTGISINSSSLSNGLINNGTISTEAAGILISNGSDVGGIVNNGSIVSANGTGVQVINSSTINGGISNSGTITAGGFDEGITIGFNSRVNGDISNSGIINSGPGGNGIIIFLTNTIDGNISNSGTINAGNTGISAVVNATINGNILNSGSIEAGSNGIRIRNASSVSGNIFNSGLINAGDHGILIDSATTVNNISNSGTIQADNTGIAVSSTSAISGGISNSGTIQGGTNAIFIDPSSNVSQIDILGQHARLIGAVDAVNTDVNITSGAVFTSEGTFNVNNFNIAANAIFNMANSITAQNTVTNAGTLAVGNTTQTINSLNGYIQSTGGVLQIGVVNSQNYGQLIVNNTVDLSQSGNVNVQIGQNTTLHNGDVLSNVISGGSLITPTNGFNVTDNSIIWNFTAKANGSAGVDLTANINPTAYSICQGDYCQGAATTIIEQIAAGNSAFNSYALLTSASAFKTAASQATPELTNENIQVTQLITQSVMDIIPMWGVLHGKSAGDAMLYQPGKIWLKPYDGSMTQNKSNSVDGFNTSVYGVAIGEDIQLTDAWLLGGAFAVGKDNMHGKDVLSGQSIDSDTYQGTVYVARKFPDNIYLAGQGLIGYGDNDTNRSIPLYASSAAGSYNSWFTNLRAQVGWSVYALNQDLILTPDIDASYLYVYQSSYHESGSPMDLSVAANNNASFVLGAYGNGAYRLASINNEDLMLTAYAGIARNMLNSQPQTTATFVAGGSNFTTPGLQFNQLVFRGGLGLSISNPTKPLKVNLNYDMQTGNKAHSGVGEVTVSYKM